MDLPRLDVAIRSRPVIADARLDRACRPPRDSAKPMFEAQRGFEGGSTQTVNGYRRRASLT